MHYHVPKPFYRKSRDTWYVEVDGRQINLGKDREAAFQRYHAIMAAPPEVRPTRVMGTGDGLKVTELFDRFLDWVKQHRSPDTYVWYQYRLQRFADRFPDLTVEQLRPFHVQEWVDSFPDHSPTTTRNYMRSVKCCFKWGQTLGYIDKNPIQHISIPASQPKDVYVPPEEFAALVAISRDQSFRDLLEVTYDTGCRPQESLRIEIRHIDLKNQRWVLPRSEAKGKQAPRIVYLNDKSVAIMQRLIGNRTEGLLFLNSRGKPWTTSAVNCAFQRIQHRMGMAEMKRQGISVGEEKIAELIPTLSKTHRVGKKVVAKTEAELRHEAKRKLTYQMAQESAPKYSLYALRHSWATNALQRGVDALTVAILMGHKDPSQLAKVYQHLSHNPKHLLEQAKKAAS
jgi:integrase